MPYDHQSVTSSGCVVRADLSNRMESWQPEGEIARDDVHSLWDDMTDRPLSV